MTSIITDHLEQPDQYTCQSAAISKVLGHTSFHQVYEVRAALLNLARQYGSMAGDPRVMGAYLQGKVKEYRYNGKASLDEVWEWVAKDGRECIIHGFTTGSGHVWGIEGVQSREQDNRVNFVCDDPWYEFDFPNHAFTRRSGANVPYSDVAIWAYCVKAWNENQAINAYRQGLNSVGSESFVDQMYSEQGAWVHFIKN